MKQLSNHYKDVEDPIERYRFALAAYNAGFGHVDDARKLARGEGKDHKQWRTVADYMLKLADRKYYAKTRFGYCRGAEPVEYVRKTDERYTGYSQLVPLQAANADRGRRIGVARGRFTVPDDIERRAQEVAGLFHAG